jgi:hypothetical protein
MILYYALGGGLGHIARSLVLIDQAPEELRGQIRLLVSSRSAEAARPVCPCPLDIVPLDAMVNGRTYASFLDSYINKHRFSCIIVDTFPFGLLGELAMTAANIPRFMIGRYLRWDSYKQRIEKLSAAVWPIFSVMIETQSEEYLTVIRHHGQVVQYNSPLSLARAENISLSEKVPAWCVVHSGEEEELNALLKFARQLMLHSGAAGEPEIITPDQQVFPLEQKLDRFSDVVSGAGYASCAASVVLKDTVRYHLHPFPRRYDDQESRVQQIRNGSWGVTDRGAGQINAGQLLWDEVRKTTG